jgi:hypothetical protein
MQIGDCANIQTRCQNDKGHSLLRVLIEAHTGIGGGNREDVR